MRSLRIAGAKIVKFSERGGGMAQKFTETGIKYDNFIRNGLWGKAKGHSLWRFGNKKCLRGVGKNEMDLKHDCAERAKAK